MIKNLALVSVGAIAAMAIPSFASGTTQSVTEAVSLTPNQVEFVRQVDAGFGTKFSSLVNTPGANQIIKSASLACGNIQLQKQTIAAIGGTEVQANYSSRKFQSLFCGNAL